MLVERSCMGIAYVYKQITALAAGTPLLLSLSLGGCATSTAGSSLMDARAETPASPKASVYLPVEDLPPKREKPAMTPDERLKLQKELIAARDRQVSGGKAKGRCPRSTHEALDSESRPKTTFVETRFSALPGRAVLASPAAAGRPTTEAALPKTATAKETTPMRSRLRFVAKVLVILANHEMPTLTTDLAMPRGPGNGQAWPPLRGLRPRALGLRPISLDRGGGATHPTFSRDDPGNTAAA